MLESSRWPLVPPLPSRHPIIESPGQGAGGWQGASARAFFVAFRSHRAPLLLPTSAFLTSPPLLADPLLPSCFPLAPQLLSIPPGSDTLAVQGCPCIAKRLRRETEAQCPARGTQHHNLTPPDAPWVVSETPFGVTPAPRPPPCSVLRVLAGALLPADHGHAAEDAGDAQVGCRAPPKSLSLCPHPHPHRPALLLSALQEQPEGAVPRGRARCLLQSPHPPPFPTSHRLLDELRQLPDGFCLPG